LKELVTEKPIAFAWMLRTRRFDRIAENKIKVAFTIAETLTYTEA
jgi:hypothetical protein